MVPRKELCNGLIGVGDEGRWMARTAAEDDFRDDGLSLRFARCCARFLVWQRDGTGENTPARR